MEYSHYTYTNISAQAMISAFKPSDGIAEYHIIVTVNDPKLPFAEQLEHLLEAYKKTELRIREEHPNVKAVMKRYLLSDVVNQSHYLPKDDDCAVSVIGQAPLNGSKIALWAYLIEDIALSRTPRGMAMAKHGIYNHLWHCGMAAPDLSSEVATIALLGDYSRELNSVGCTLKDNCMRTWLFVHDVDVNYRGVVSGRNEVFRCLGLTQDTHYIASTGIGGSHPNPHVTVDIDTYAVEGIKPEQISYLKAPTHLNPTYEYGVAFERGTTIDYGDRRHLLISGTASINNKGEVMYPGHIIKQTERMIENVEALLSAAESSWSDVAHAIVYLRDIADYQVVSEIFGNKFPNLPVVIVYAPVCRDGWLIEMECMAIREASNPLYAPL